MEEQNEMSSKPQIELITCDSGDWKVLRVNLGEDFNYEGHSIPDGVWVEMISRLGFEVETNCISDEDMEYGKY
jgi:hypothetical protein